MRVNKSTIRRMGLILAVLMCCMSLSGCYSVMGTSNSGSTIVQQESAPYVDTGCLLYTSSCRPWGLTKCELVIPISAA